MRSLDFWRYWLLIASVLLAVQSVSWIVIGSFDPFGIYDGLLSRVISGANEIPIVAQPYHRYSIALLGATDAAYFVLFWFVVRYPFAKQEPWAHLALATSLLTWFTLDSAFSIVYGALFNVLLVNLPCLLLMGAPLAFTAKHFKRSH